VIHEYEPQIASSRFFERLVDEISFCTKQYVREAGHEGITQIPGYLGRYDLCGMQSIVESFYHPCVYGLDKLLTASSMAKMIVA
jgi:hypothetical protein